MYTFTGLDYWTDIFLVFMHVVVALIDPYWSTESPQGTYNPSINGKPKGR